MEHLTDRQVLALRTQSAPAEEAFPLLAHAASCAMCSERVMSRSAMTLELASLRETLRGSVAHLSLDEMNDLVDGSVLPPQKARMEEHLAACSSCSEHVVELRAMARPVPAPLPQQQGFTGWLGAFFTLPRMVVATAMLLLVAILSGWFLLRHRAAEPQIAALPTTITTPPETGRIATEAGPQTGGGGTGKTRPAQGARGRGSILVIGLVPGIVRGESSVKTAHLSAQTDTVLLALSSRAELTPGRYRVTVMDGAEHGVWRREVVYDKPPDAVHVRVPAMLLAGGRYTVTLAAVETNGTSENLDEYAFDVVR